MPLSTLIHFHQLMLPCPPNNYCTHALPPKKISTAQRHAYFRTCLYQITLISSYLNYEAVLLGRELLAGHVDEGEAQHESNHRIVGFLLEGGHVLTQRILQIRKTKHLTMQNGSKCYFRTL